MQTHAGSSSTQPQQHASLANVWSWRLS